MSKGSQYTFTSVALDLKSLASKERKDQLLQYNIDKNLQFARWRFTGSEPKTSNDYEQLLSEFLNCPSVTESLAVSGSLSNAAGVDASPLKLTVTSMTFFDKLEDTDVVGPGGQIKGCFDETFEGITVGDKLREMLLNQVSDNADLFNADEKAELIFNLFKIIAVGGALCQPDNNIARYLDLTKELYKELVTIYRDSKTDIVQFSGRVFRINSVSGMELFPENPNCSLNAFIVIVDGLKKNVTVVKNNFKPFW